ncbi:DUF2635 domain-containing protein [Pseudomonas solani]|uniref:DUF2635 domain-containing protein n=1 Tax=Pseudomonas solani TaxID=2731552 RepID=A0AAU7Y4R5_9PSED
MSQSIYLVPADGLLVRHPQGGYLKAKGDNVVLDGYWHRRMADGSVTEGKKKGDKPETPKE